MNAPSARRDEEGVATVEFVGSTLILILAVALLIFAGRYGQSRAATSEAASAASRAASISRTAAAAQSSADAAARQVLESEGMHCIELTVDTDTSGFLTDPGQPANVRVDVTCTIDTSPAAPLGVPGAKTFHASATDALDTYRARS